MKAYVFTEACIKNILGACLLEDHKTRYFQDIIYSNGISLVDYVQGVLTGYVSCYQSLAEVGMPATEHNRIYDSFEPVSRFITDDRYGQELLIQYVYPVDSTHHYLSDVNDMFSSYLYDDVYSMIEDSLGYEDIWDDTQKPLPPDQLIFENMEAFVETTKHVVKSIDAIILPVQFPLSAVSVVFAVKKDSLIAFVQD